jgi:hypothetical protein
MEKENKKNIAPYFIIFAGVVTLWCLSWYLITTYVNTTEQGQFGDMFGAVNALFSGLAFAGIIITILLQKEELTLQRQELKDTRKEFGKQNETLSLQRFETTFFNLLNLHINLISNL